MSKPTYRARIIELQDLAHKLSSDLHYSQENQARRIVDDVYYKLGDAKETLAGVVL